jgi:hypothetical protein
MPDRSKGRGQTKCIADTPHWGLGVGLTTPLRNNLLLRNHRGGQSPHRVAELVHNISLHIKVNQNYIPDEIKSRLNSGNSSCQQVHNLWSSFLRSIKAMLKHSIQYWALVLRLCPTLKKNRVLSRIFAPQREELTGGRNNI